MLAEEIDNHLISTADLEWFNQDFFLRRWNKYVFINFMQRFVHCFWQLMIDDDWGQLTSARLEKGELKLRSAKNGAVPEHWRRDYFCWMNFRCVISDGECDGRLGHRTSVRYGATYDWCKLSDVIMAVTPPEALSPNDQRAVWGASPAELWFDVFFNLGICGMLNLVYKV